MGVLGEASYENIEEMPDGLVKGWKSPFHLAPLVMMQMALRTADRGWHLTDAVNFLYSPSVRSPS